MDTKKIPVICDENGFCKPAHLPGGPLEPYPLCTVTITYPKDSPEQPMVKFTPDTCPNPEVALAVLLAALLKANLP